MEDDDYQGLIHLQIACLTRYTNSCVAAGKIDEVRRIFDFFHQIIEKVNAATENALYISFLEHLEIDADNDKAQEVRKLLKPEYLKIWKELKN